LGSQGFSILRNKTNCQSNGSIVDPAVQPISPPRRENETSPTNPNMTVHSDAYLIAAFNRLHPQADEVIAVEGLLPFDSTIVLPHLVRKDAHFRKARKTGSVQTSLNDSMFADIIPPDIHHPDGFVRISVQQNPNQPNKLWCAVSYHREDSSQEGKTRNNHCVLQPWIQHYETPDDPGIVRLLLGHDDRIILINTTGQQLLSRYNISTNNINDEVQSVIDERYPDLPNNENHDMMLTLGTEFPWWIHYETRNPLNGDYGQQKHLELMPLPQNKIIPVGVVGDVRVARALAFLHDHYQESPGLDKIAAASESSFFYCHRLFTSHVGISPKHYLWQIQMFHAQKLLRTSTLPINEVARKVGYTNHGHFTSVFTKSIGMNPREYRKQTLLSPPPARRHQPTQ